MGLYINLSQSKAEHFDTDGKLWFAFRFPAFPMDSAKATGTITYRAGEPNSKPHPVGFVSSAFGFLLF